MGSAVIRRGYLAVVGYAYNPNIREAGVGKSQRGYPRLLNEVKRKKDVNGQEKDL